MNEILDGGNPMFTRTHNSTTSITDKAFLGVGMVVFFSFFFYDNFPFDQYCMIYIIPYINLHVGMRKITHSIRIWKSGRKPVMRTCIVNIVCSL